MLPLLAATTILRVATILFKVATSLLRERYTKKSRTKVENSQVAKNDKQRTCSHFSVCCSSTPAIDSTCDNFEGGFECVCDPGYEFNEGGDTCVECTNCSVLVLSNYKDYRQPMLINFNGKYDKGFYGFIGFFRVF